ncbi:MAG: crossover junction endodeoxyribonuclease RuvC [bacterium]|nr:crossover junction endodeoxyribonuclease RuvC [bacterium]
MRVLAIDPGYERLGIAVLEKKDGKEILLYSDCFKTSSKLPFENRLILIGEELSRIIGVYKPEALAIETLFFNSNQKTAMRVAEARGVIIYASVSRGLTLYEYTPLQIKIAVTGYGKADKEQVSFMIQKLLGLTGDARHDDETDAIAVGITCIASRGIQNSKKDFL